MFFFAQIYALMAVNVASDLVRRGSVIMPSSAARSWVLPAGGVRINTAGCLDRCAEGPVLAVYPESVWYSYIDREDIDEIIDEHLQNGRVVERLRI